MKNLFFILSVLIFISCKVDVTDDNDFKSEVKPTNFIYEFYAQGTDCAVHVSWFPISSEYDVFLSYCDTEQNHENVVKINPGQTSFSLGGLTNATKDLSFFYEFTLTVKDKNGAILEQQKTGATPASSLWEYESAQQGEGIPAWFLLLSPDSKIPQGNDLSGLDIASRLDSNTCYVGKIKGAGLYTGYPTIYNNPESVTAIVEHGKFTATDVYKNKFLDLLEEGEEIQWFSTFKISQRIEVYGKIVKTAVKEKEYNYSSEFYVDTATEIKNIQEPFRVGAKIFTKGYYFIGDGGACVYEIANRPLYKYGSVKTKVGQYCNIIVENNKINLVSLGAGKCFQVTKANYNVWQELNEAEKANNDDAARIAEAKSLLTNSRKNKNEIVTLFIPKGNYRIGSSITITEENFVLKGETIRRDLTPDDIASFEENYALGNEIGSSDFNGSVLYTDNGSNFGGFGIFGPANNVTVDGITLEARETDSKKTFWHSVDDSEFGPYTDINYEGRGTCEKTMADEQWYSRQVSISQCSNVTIKNCEFIITSHVRDEAVNQNGNEYKYNSDGTIQLYQANPYVEACDLHTDKQFTSVTFFDSWKNVTVDDCLLYNMSGVFRGASFGFLDIYGGQCNNGTLSNNTLFHNCHDEQIGIFTLTPSAGNYKENEYIDGVNITGNKIYPMSDEHVDKIKSRVMVISVGYDFSKNINNVSIKGNTFYAENLPSKLITFGGFVSDGRKNIVVSDNIINMKNSGGVYLFETRPYVEIKNNIINFESDSGTIYGSIFDCTNKDHSVEPKFVNNVVNVNCNYAGSITHNGGKSTNGIVSGNQIYIKGNQTNSLFLGNSQVTNNKITIDGRMKTVYFADSNKELASDILIDNNALIYNFDDTSDDYTLPQASGGFYQTGRTGCTFVDIASKSVKDDYCVYISNNQIKAPLCTTRNKHLLRYTNPSFTVSITKNKLQKFFYLRGLSEANQDKIIYSNNCDSKGNALNKSDWLFENALKDTD